LSAAWPELTLHAAFERGGPPLQHFIGRIADAAVAEPLGFEIEQRGAMLGTVEFVSDGLIDRHRHGFSGRLSDIATVDGDSFISHARLDCRTCRVTLAQLEFVLLLRPSLASSLRGRRRVIQRKRRK
jgi:hypothetical protein